MSSAKLILSNQHSEFSKLSSFWQKLASQKDLEANLSLQVEVCLDEIFTNIVSYAYQDNKEHKIEVEFDFQENKLQIRIIDNGEEFDPTTSIEPELISSIEERSIGGLGIHMVRKIMDKLIYERKQNKNILILQKYL